LIDVRFYQVFNYAYILTFWVKVVKRFINFLTHLLTKIKNAPQLLSGVRYGNCSAQTNSSSQQHFAGIVPGPAVEIEFDSRF